MFFLMTVFRFFLYSSVSYWRILGNCYGVAATDFCPGWPGPAETSIISRYKQPMWHPRPRGLYGLFAVLRYKPQWSGNLSFFSTINYLYFISHRILNCSPHHSTCNIAAARHCFNVILLGWCILGVKYLNYDCK